MKKILTLLFCTFLLSIISSCQTIDSSSSNNYISNYSSLNNTTSNTITSDQEIFSSPSKEEISVDKEEVRPIKKIKIYLNPSVQMKNMYYNNITTEAKAMNIVAEKIYKKLVNDIRFIVYINNSMKSLSEAIKESNSLNVDYHLALHTNAGGGSGSECFYYSNSTFANQILNEFSSYHNFKNRGVKKATNLYELKNSTAKNKALMEFLFHDNQKESEFIVNNYDLLAKSVIETFNKIANLSNNK